VKTIAALTAGARKFFAASGGKAQEQVATLRRAALASDVLAMRRVELLNTMQLCFFEFAPRLIRHLTYEELKTRPQVLKNVGLDLSTRMARALGMCYPERRRIALNEPYFLKNPRYLPYTLYHEMVHMFLYDAGRPWGHTREFYALMEEFPSEKYPTDPNVHIHGRQARSGKRQKQQKDEVKAQEETMTAFIARVFGSLK
jgi:SprT-like family